MKKDKEYEETSYAPIVGDIAFPKDILCKLMNLVRKMNLDANQMICYQREL